MKVNVFRDYHDTNPKDSSLEEVVRIIREDASIKDRTEKHRYYRSQGLNQAATNEKQSCLCFSVATLFEGGKTQKHIAGWPGIGMVDFDDLDEEDIDELAEKARKDKHTLLVYKTMSGRGIRILFLYYAAHPQNLTDKQQKLIYEVAFEQANGYYRRLLGAKPDPKCKTCTQLSGVAHDPNVFYNPDAEAFQLNAEKILSQEQERKAAQKQLRKAVKAAQKQLADEGIVFAPGSHNEYVMRMGYLLNAYGIREEDAYHWMVEQYSADYDGDIYAIVESCYKHTDEHGTRKIPHTAMAAYKEDNRMASVEEIEQFIRSQVSVRFNVIRRQCEIAWKDAPDDTYSPITDRDENTLWCRMKKNGAEVRLADIRNVLQSEYVPLFHPFEAYFGSLPDWDGVDYIGQLARTVHVKGDSERFVEHFRKWFVGMVATIFDEQVVNHEIMVFIGKQGNFKSTFFSLLLPPPLRSYFQVKMNSSHLNKDDMLTLCEKALVCLEEIDELRPSELNQLKALVTAKNISERAAYARNKEHRPHIASFCGTGNNPQFLSDPTDNRRWLVVEVEDIDNPWQQPFHYTGIYSQAWALWKSGFQYWFDQDEILLLNRQNKEFEVPNPEEELLLTYYRPTFKGCQDAIFLKVSEILERINAGIKQPLSATKLGMLLSKLGFTKSRYNNERGYLVIERSMDEIQASRKIAAKEIQR